jgi:RimJ/RimL family protein N-acetyltransferase
MSDLIVRPLRAGEESLFDSLPDPMLVGRGAFGATYATGNYRPEWTWVALRDDVVVARAAWWAGPDDAEPKALDWFDFTDADAAVHLLRTAPFHVEYSIPLPPNWRDDPAVHAAATARVDAAKAAGMTFLVERYGYGWTPECGLPERPQRLEFRPEPDDDVIFEVFRRVNATSVDAHVRQTIAEKGLDASAQEDLDLLRWMPSPREWWRLAYTPDGELVGLAAPCYHYSAHVVGYIAVVPEQRGHGYSYDLLAETTHMLAAEGAQKIVAGTDVANTRMAKSFAKAGYPVTQRRIDLLP